jgi:mono/diheme cytochrome c family protein
MGNRQEIMKPSTGILFALIILGMTALAIARSRPASAQEIHAGSYQQQSGEALYEGVCQGCHMPDAHGALGAGAYPALASNTRLRARMYPILVVINGQKAMPPFGAELSDEQIANVINYIRTRFGNHYTDPVSSAEVRAARGKSD